MLATATSLIVEEIVYKARELNGIVIPSHIDRPYNSIISNLGFIPPELDISIVEISRNNKPEKIIKKFTFLKNYSYIINSDSHFLKELKPGMEIYLKENNIKKICLDQIINTLENM